MNILKLKRGSRIVLVNMDNVTHITKLPSDDCTRIEFTSRNSGKTMGSQYMSEWTHGVEHVDETPDEIYELCLKLKNT